MTLDDMPLFAMLKSKMGYETQRRRRGHHLRLPLRVVFPGECAMVVAVGGNARRAESRSGLKLAGWAARILPVAFAVLVLVASALHPQPQDDPDHFAPPVRAATVG